MQVDYARFHYFIIFFIFLLRSGCFLVSTILEEDSWLLSLIPRL